MRPRSAAPGLRRQATEPGEAGGARARAEPGGHPGSAASNPGSSAFLGGAGPGTAKVAVADPGTPGRARPATHLSRVDRRSDSAPTLPRSSCGPRRVAGARPLPRAARVWRRRAPAGLGGDAEPRACDSARFSLAPSPRVPAQPSGERPGDPGPAAGGARGVAGARAECRPRCAPSRRLCGAERSWAERGARFPRFPKGHPGGGAP